jgi:PST family polysaccharide transporter
MFATIKAKFLDTDEKRILVSNIFSLGVLQAANYILPLLTMPYLVRVLGPEYFGLLAFATATIAYFMLITDYGFNLSATRQISINRDDKDKIKEIFSAVMMIKIVLTLVSLTLMTLLVFSFDKFSQHWQVYFLTFGMVIGQVFFPVWLFQGMEHMKYIAYLNIGAKAFFTICIFIFVQEKSDYLLVPFLTSLGFLIAGIFSLYLVRKKFEIRFSLQPWEILKYYLVDGWHVFFSSIAISFYTISTTFILGLFTNNTVVGYFSVADKIVQAIKGLYGTISQAIYPLVCKKIQENRHSGLLFIRRFTKIAGFLMLSVSLMVYVMADPIVNILLGDQYQRSITLLKVMAPLPFIIALSNIYGVQIMLNFGYKRAFTRILVFAAIVGILLSLKLVPIYQGLGTAVTILMVEVFVTISMFSYLRLWRKVKC